MAYVNVPNDLSKIKSKIALNLTKRQLICFGAAAVVGIPAYLFTRTVIGNSAAMLLMIALMLPAFMLAMYERDGLPAEKVVRNIIRARLLWPGVRPYKTENFYQWIVDSEQLTVNESPAAMIKNKSRSDTTIVNYQLSIVNCKTMEEKPLDTAKKAQAAAPEQGAKKNRAPDRAADHPLP